MSVVLARSSGFLFIEFATVTQNDDRGWNRTFVPVDINPFITHPAHERLYHTTRVYAPYSLRTAVWVILCPTRIVWKRVLRHTNEPQKGRDNCLRLQSCSVLSSFGVVLMSCKVNFHAVRSWRSALQYSACRIQYVWGKKHFLVWNRVRICINSRHTATKNSQPTPGTRRCLADRRSFDWANRSAGFTSSLT